MGLLTYLSELNLMPSAGHVVLELHIGADIHLAYLAAELFADRLRHHRRRRRIDIGEYWFGLGCFWSGVVVVGRRRDEHGIRDLSAGLLEMSATGQVRLVDLVVHAAYAAHGAVEGLERLEARRLGRALELAARAETIAATTAAREAGWSFLSSTVGCCSITAADTVVRFHAWISPAAIRLLLYGWLLAIDRY